MPAPGTLRTTTARFDAEMWAAIEHHSTRLGIAHAEFIRGAVHHRLTQLDRTDRLTRLEQRVEAVAERGERVARVGLRAARSHTRERRGLAPTAHAFLPERYLHSTRTS